MGLFSWDPGLAIVVILKELLLAVGFGLLSIVLTAKKGRMKHLAGVGFMIVLSVLPDALAGIDFAYSHILPDLPVKTSFAAYFRGYTPMWIARICVGYLIGMAIWRKKISAKL